MNCWLNAKREFPAVVTNIGANGRLLRPKTGRCPSMRDGLLQTLHLNSPRARRPSGGSIDMGKKRDIVQVKNPRTGHYVKIDRGKGRIIAHKKSEGPYKGVPIARKRAE